MVRTPEAETHLTRYRGLVQKFVRDVSGLPYVMMVLVAGDKGHERVYTIIDAPPFNDREERDRVYDLEAEALRGVRDPSRAVDFRLINSQEVIGPLETHIPSPDVARTVFQRPPQ